MPSFIRTKTRPCKTIYINSRYELWYWTTCRRNIVYWFWHGTYLHRYMRINIAKVSRMLRINEGVFVCKKKFINHWKRNTRIHSLLIDFYWLHSKSNPVCVMCILHYTENGRNIIREYDAYIFHLGMYRISKQNFIGLRCCSVITSYEIW